MQTKFGVYGNKIDNFIARQSLKKKIERAEMLIDCGVMKIVFKGTMLLTEMAIESDPKVRAQKRKELHNVILQLELINMVRY